MPINKKPHNNISPAVLKKMYITMLRIRRVEEKIGELVRAKEIICPCHLYIGQEAIATGVCSALRKEDYVFSTHRSHGHYIAKGGDINTLMAELYGKITGCSKGRGGSMHITSPDIGFPGSSAIVTGTIPLAVGVGLSFHIREKDNVAVAFFGDGATNEGAFYESLNFAALKKLPVIFVCENNLYSTHMNISKCLSDTRIYKKAEAFKMPGVCIDGNDTIKVFEQAKKAIDFAREGKGPSLLECLTYRWRGHVGPNIDVDKGLRSEKELKSWMAKCPIKRLEAFLMKQDILSKSEKEKISKQINKEIEESLAFAEKGSFPKANELHKYVFAKDLDTKNLGKRI